MFRTSQRIVVSVLLITVVVNAILAQDRPVAREFDPGIKIDIDAGRFRYDVYFGREKSEELEAGDTKIGGGVSLRFKPLFKTFIDAFDTDKQHVFVGRFGYEFSRAGENDQRSKTHKLLADGTLRWGFPKKILVSDANRFGLRWIDGEPSIGYRNRLTVERPFQIFKREFTPYGWAEAYWDGRFRSWNKFRYTGGAEVPLPFFRVPYLRRTTLDVFFTRERCTTCPDPHTDIIGLNMNIFLRLKK